ncbi:hypothetical protein SFC55_25110 [Niallia taxi]|uniref:coiled-coil domain-containing protein n=1 Tax=Niallia taxi TaxID=2499688 RepID=UPI0039819E79
MKEKLLEIRKKAIKFRKKIKLSLTQLYLTCFWVFVATFLFIFISPMIFGGNYSYAEAKVNEHYPINNGVELALTKKEYNPEKQFMRLDFSIEKSNSNSNLSNIEYQISSQYIKDRKPLNVEVTKVNDNYVVAIIKGIPEGYSVLSTTIKPEYVHPELEKVDDLNDREVKIYVNENSKIENNELKIGTEKQYQIEYINYQQKQIREQIEESKKEISKNNLAIEEVNKTIKKLENEMSYQTESEKFTTQNDMNSNKTKIQQFEEKIDFANKTMEELNVKMKLLEEKKTTVN